MTYLIFITPMNKSQIHLALLTCNPVNSVLEVEPTNLFFIMLLLFNSVRILSLKYNYCITNLTSFSQFPTCLKTKLRFACFRSKYKLKQK